jgi:ribosomal protein S18 acetylase RimI-like enzyme
MFLICGPAPKSARATLKHCCVPSTGRTARFCWPKTAIKPSDSPALGSSGMTIHFCCEDARRHAYVSDIFVGEAWRRRGVGRTLLTAIEAEMRRRGCRRIRICSKAANLAAVSCHQSAGYRPYEIIYAKAIR